MWHLRFEGGCFNVTVRPPNPQLTRANNAICNLSSLKRKNKKSSFRLPQNKALKQLQNGKNNSKTRFWGHLPIFGHFGGIFLRPPKPLFWIFFSMSGWRPETLFSLAGGHDRNPRVRCIHQKALKDWSCPRCFARRCSEEGGHPGN